MTPAEANELIITPAMAFLPREMDTVRARVMLLAIGYQESKFKERRQLDGGPARGFWQFERGGGCKGVCEHAASRYWMNSVCNQRKIVFTPTSLYAALDIDDVVACAAARLLLFTDPSKLPTARDRASAWSLYQRVWRPGAPRPDDWPRSHDLAIEEVMRTDGDAT